VDHAVLREVYGPWEGEGEYGENGMPKAAGGWADRRFDPSRSNQEARRPFHPDMVSGLAAVGLAVLVRNLYASTQSPWLLPLGVLFAWILLYLPLRKTWLAKYHSANAQRTKVWNVLDQDMARWHQTYYCTRDAVIFERDNHASPTSASAPFLDWSKVQQ